MIGSRTVGRVIIPRLITTKSSKRTYTWESGKRNLQSHGGTSGEVKWWQPDPALVKRTQNTSKTHVIFLEGPCGTGKADLLWRLSRMNLDSVSGTFFKFLESHPVEIQQHADVEKANKLWVENLMKTVEEEASKKHKSNVLFVNRSPISSWAHLGTPEAQAMKDSFLSWKKKTDSSVIFCLSDNLRRQERIGQRVLAAHGHDLKIRNLLGEYDVNGDYISSDPQRATSQRYEDLIAQGGVFDCSIATTSAKQATAQILKVCGVEFISSFGPIPK